MTNLTVQPSLWEQQCEADFQGLLPWKRRREETAAAQAHIARINAATLPVMVLVGRREYPVPREIVGRVAAGALRPAVLLENPTVGRSIYHRFTLNVRRRGRIVVPLAEWLVLKALVNGGKDGASRKVENRPVGLDR